MSLTQIQNFMNDALPYPDEDDEDGGGGSGGGGGTGRDGGDGGSDKNDEDGGGSDSRKRKRSASGGKSCNAWARGSREKYAKMEDEELEYVEPKNYNPKCKVSLRICDKEGKDKNDFLPTEDMFMEVTAFNGSGVPRHIDLNKGTFAFSGRGGHNIRIKSIKSKYTPSENLSAYKLVTINPGEERTFNTKFAIGLLQRNERDWCSVRTPTEAGEYEAGFYVNPQSDVCLGSAKFRIQKFDIAKSGLRRQSLSGYYYYP